MLKLFGIIEILRIYTLLYKYENVGLKILLAGTCLAHDLFPFPVKNRHRKRKYVDFHEKEHIVNQSFHNSSEYVAHIP